ncbi:hypothetical protein [Chlamydia vaughanii]|uniref:hypothetical protein n=1 Tax=Chlamydia vaughanii TaxID=3112552 RepID=UPI0032B2AF1B
MVKPHDYGAFSNHSGRNVFTIQDLETTGSRRDHPRGSRVVTRQPQAYSTGYLVETRIEIPKCSLIQEISFWSILCVIGIISAALIIGSSAYTAPAILAALILQIIIVIAAAIVLASRCIKHFNNRTERS